MPRAFVGFAGRARERAHRDPMAARREVADHVERPDLAAALGREREAVAEVQDVHAAKLLQLVGNVARRAAVEVHPAPDLEVHQRQQRVGAVDAVGLVIGEQALTASTWKSPRSRTTSGREQASQHRRELLLQPGAHRRAEAALGSIEDVGRQQVGERSLHQ